MADPEQALALNNLSFDLADEGRHDEALSAITETVTLYTPLVCSDPDTYRVDYGEAVELLTAHLRKFGRTDQEIADELRRLHVS
jgi:hypothetical protein